MNTHLTIVTGASRGLGLAMTEQRLARGDLVVAIARHPTVAVEGAGKLLSWALDLSDPEAAASRLQQWLQTQSAQAFASVSLINNAAVITPPAPLSMTSDVALSQALRVGLEAPVLLTAAFLRATATWTMPRKLLLISSGLGRRAMAGAACYCAIKAGMDHLARSVALEEERLPHGVRIVSLAPGVIDTEMQVQLRGADPALFPDRERFIGLQQAGQLDSPASAATKVLKVLDRADFGSQPVADVRDA
jgi:benzil reductase ((S)-benzoin forming)